MRMLVLPQFDGPQMITRMIFGSISPYAIFALFRTASHYPRFCVTVHDAYRQRLPHESHIRTIDYALSNTYLKARESCSSKMYFALYHPSNILEGRAVAVYKKVILLRVYDAYIDHV